MCKPKVKKYASCGNINCLILVKNIVQELNPVPQHCRSPNPIALGLFYFCIMMPLYVCSRLTVSTMYINCLIFSDFFLLVPLLHQ